MIRRRLPLFVAGLLALFAGGARGQSPFQGLESEARLAGPPAWLKEGVRLTYRVSGSGQSLSGPRRGGASVGLAHVDFTSLAEGAASGVVVSWATVQPAPGAAGGWVPTTTNGFTGPAGCGEFWAHPEVLRRAAEYLTGSPGWEVQRGPFEGGGRKVEAVSFTRQGDEGLSISRFVYEAETGLALLIDKSSRTQIRGDWQTLAVFEYLGRRERKLPWIEGRPPSWLGKCRRLVFEGRRVTAVPGSPEYANPARSVFEISGHGLNCLFGRQSVEQQGSGPGQPVFMVSGGSGTGGFWLPPLALREIDRAFSGTEMEIDADPWTGARTAIVFKGQAPHGRNVITVLDQTPAYRSWSDYEIETGILVHMTTQVYALYSTIQFWFTGWEGRP